MKPSKDTLDDDFDWDDDFDKAIKAVKDYQEQYADEPIILPLSPVNLATLFHNTYERLAPDFGYETRPDTKDFNPDSPNGRLMIAVCAEVLEILGV